MYANWANDPLVCRYLSWLPHESIEATRSIVAEWLLNYGSECYYHWGITLSGELIGDISIVRWNEMNEEAEIGYCLGRRFWGQGLMTEALEGISFYLFDRIGFHRIVLHHDSENQASGRVMQKVGFLYEGCLKEAQKRRDGGWADLCVYGATRMSLGKKLEEQSI